MRYLILFVVALSLTGCPKKEVKLPQAPQAPMPKRVIFFLGDGMGLGAITAATYADGEPLAMTTAPHFGFVQTHEHEFMTTDSAASATAFATGHKTHFNGISVTPGTTRENETDPARHLKTWFESAREKKLGTGLVTTCRVNHATPAAFVAHRATRKDYETIAADMVRFGPDVLLGSGSKYFNQREDQRDLIEDLVKRGWIYTDTPEGLAQVRSKAIKLAGLFYEGDAPFLTEEQRAVPLPQMTEVAIEVLDRSYPDGWVLMVEGSFIDWCEHSLDPKCTIAETLEFDDAVQSGLAYANQRTDTLVVVTADHETGGLSVIDPAYAERFEALLGGHEAAKSMVQLPDVEGKPRSIPDPVQHFPLGQGSLTDQMTDLQDRRFTTVFGHMSVGSAPYWKSDGRFYASHTAEAVPLWASGPYAEWVAGARDNAEVGKRIKQLVEGVRPEMAAPTSDTKKSKNLVVMIGDGMGIASVSGTQYRDGPLNMFDLPVHGLLATHTGDKLVADSASTATAIGSGKISGRYRVGQDVKGGDTTSILEAVSRRGLGTGIITTTEITHATPAAFYAHAETRKDKAKIVADLTSFNVRNGKPLDLLIGGGQVDITPEVQAALKTGGVSYQTTWPPNATGPIVVALAQDGLALAATRRDDGNPGTPTLAEMTSMAIERLSETYPNGFVLIVEGGQIDWQLHERDNAGKTFDEIAEFDEAVAVVRTFADRDGETTLVVTADHDHTLSLLDNHYAFHSERCGITTVCGGPDLFPPIPLKPIEGFGDAALQGEKWSPNVGYMQYAWVITEAAKKTPIDGSHSATFVPLFAYGPDAESFRGFATHTDLAVRLRKVVE